MIQKIFYLIIILTIIASLYFYFTKSDRTYPNYSTPEVQLSLGDMNISSVFVELTFHNAGTHEAVLETDKIGSHDGLITGDVLTIIDKDNNKIAFAPKEKVKATYDSLILKPGQSTTTRINLLEYYDFQIGQSYSITYRAKHKIKSGYVDKGTIYEGYVFLDVKSTRPLIMEFKDDSN